MTLSEDDKRILINELLINLDGKIDGGGKNILVPDCPFCSHSGYKFGIYIGPDLSRKTFGSSNCFHCGRSFKTLSSTLNALDMGHLAPSDTVELGTTLTNTELFND